MPPGATRRGLLQELARHIAPALAGDAPAEVDHGPVVPPPSRMASTEELIALTREAGLAHRSDVVQSLAARTVRLSPSTAVDDSAGWWSGADRPTLALSLDAVAAALGEEPPGLPATGCLRIAVDGVRPHEPTPVAMACEVVVEPGEPSAPTPSSTPMAMAGEVILPRVWSAAVEAAGLGDDERDAWTELRRALARAQGSGLPDEDESHAAVHRLLGYAHETTGQLPAACDLQVPPTPDDKRLPEERWRLLVQLSAHGGVPWPWGPERTRVYVWVPRDRPLDAAGATAVALLR
jgi:hypothetical protein